MKLNLLNNEAEKLLKSAGKMFYVCANKLGPMLANLINVHTQDTKPIKPSFNQQYNYGKLSCYSG